MPKIVLSVALAAGVFFAAAIFVVLRQWKPADSEVAAGADRERDFVQLEEQVSALREQLDGLLARVQELDAAVGRVASEATALRPRDPAEATAGDKRGADRPSGGDEPLADVLRGPRSDELREFIYEVVEDERQARREEQTRQWQERRREWQELQKGPYGKYNYKVNTIAKKLGLTELQKLRYHELLQAYDGQFAELRKGPDRKDAEARRAHRERKDELSRAFDAEVVQILTPAQAGEYENLSSWEKGPEGGTMVFATSALGASEPAVVEIGEGGTGAIQIRTSTVEVPAEGAEE